MNDDILLRTLAQIDAKLDALSVMDAKLDAALCQTMYLCNECSDRRFYVSWPSFCASCGALDSLQPIETRLK
jgi:hypothetical protein